MSAQDWLSQFGLVLDFENHPFAERPERYPRGWWIASVDSERFEGTTHAVVMAGQDVEGDRPLSQVAHDPSPYPRTRPYRFCGRYWFEALAPAAIARAMR